MKKVIFICRRNRLRSQTAQMLYNALAADHSHAESYGIDPLPEEIGRLFGGFPKVVNTVEVMKRHGIDMSQASVQKLTPEVLAGASKIIILTKKEDVPEWLKSYPLEFWEVYDPPGVPTVEQTEEIVQLLEGKIREMINS